LGKIIHITVGKGKYYEVIDSFEIGFFGFKKRKNTNDIIAVHAAKPKANAGLYVFQSAPAMSDAGRYMRPVMKL
jgi:hypothetical protein